MMEKMLKQNCSKISSKFRISLRAANLKLLKLKLMLKIVNRQQLFP